MKASIMKVIGMPFVTNGGVPAVRAMLMRMILMCLASHMFLLCYGGSTIESFEKLCHRPDLMQLGGKTFEFFVP
jgi:hypothetical protein